MSEDTRPTEAPTTHASAEARDEGALGYEEARAELLDVVRTLEQGGASLEDSLALWERGERLAQVCQDWLDGARRRLEAVTDR
jgi:exodeoxyribonuclease VII small subunit